VPPRAAAHLAERLRYEEAARLRDRIEALEHVLERLGRLDRSQGQTASQGRVSDSVGTMAAWR
jgi:excinuclease UvrABC nuclease subunit